MKSSLPRSRRRRRSSPIVNLSSSSCCDSILDIRFKVPPAMATNLFLLVIVLVFLPATVTAIRPSFNLQQPQPHQQQQRRSTDLVFSHPPPSSSSSSKCHHQCRSESIPGGVTGSQHHSLSSSLVVQQQQADCPTGHYFELLVDEDGCECQLVCAKLAGQPCYLSAGVELLASRSSSSSASASPIITNHNQNALILCDPYLKLFCNESTKLCQGNLSLQIDSITDRSFTVQWTEPSMSTDDRRWSLSSSTALKSNANVYFTVYDNPGITAGGNGDDGAVNGFKFNQSEWSKIYPVMDGGGHRRRRGNGGRFATKIDGLRPNTTYLVKVNVLMTHHNDQRNGDHEEATIVTTLPKGLSPVVTPLPSSGKETLPKVSVTYRNATSITIVFDDFKPVPGGNGTGETSGYEIHYRPASKTGSLHQQWLIIRSNGTPYFTLTGLRPDTAYMIQVWSWCTVDHIQTRRSEIIEARTLGGCQFRNRSYEIGETITATATDDDCDHETCICRDGGAVDCRQRCLAPYLSIGEAKRQNRQKCARSHEDQCCVRCPAVAAAANETSIEPSGFGGKPGVCPIMAQCSSLGNECSHDYHCTGVDKCCRDRCGVHTCQTPANHHVDIKPATNDHVVGKCPSGCDPSIGECRFVEEESGYRCVCLEDFPTADDHNHRRCYRRKTVKKQQSTSHSCEFENGRRYAIGETFEHRCQICSCTEALEVECRRKCPEHDPKRLPHRCRLVNDSYDPQCCQKQICDQDDHQEHNRTETSGCRHLDLWYRVNETFYVGCQLKCHCRPGGDVQCAPRCYQDNGFDDRYCHLRPDPDDPECCKISICDFHSTTTTTTPKSPKSSLNKDDGAPAAVAAGAIANHNDSGNDHDNDDEDHHQDRLLVEMAEAINSTSIKFKLLFDNNAADDNNNGKDNLTIYYSAVPPNVTDTEQLSWKSEKVTPTMVANVGRDSTEIILSNLRPETDYSVYFRHQGTKDKSNTVVVRTFPPGIDHTFKGCFHGSQIIAVGQLFDEGDCEFKCLCKEGGIRECVERCPVFVDLIGADHRCRWVTSPDDPCCTVPVCDENEEEGEEEEVEEERVLGRRPQLDRHTCLFENGKRYRVGDQWTQGTGCLEKTCHCRLNRTTNQTEIRCQDGCPEIPAHVLKPTPECASPQLIRTRDPCTCPYVVCANNINPLDLPPDDQLHSQNAVSKLKKNYCEFKGDRINVGEEFYDGCRAICVCSVGGKLDCRPIHCNRDNFGPHTHANCLEWEIDPLFVPRPPNCCPEPKCKNDGSCSFAGIRFPNYKMIPQELLPCHKRCMCDNGNVHCRNVCPEISDQPPAGLPCPATLAFRGHLPGDDCCIHWQCREIYQDKIHGTCNYKDKTYKLGEYWDETDTEMHRRCQCKITNGILHVVCDPGLCQPITERFLEPTTECRTPTVVTPKDAIMCPYVICNNTASGGEQLDNIDIVAINATSARIRFTIPAIYVGLIGHAEVHYVTDINIPRDKWNIQKFARPKRLFDIPNIEYHLGNLRPDTTYFLQIEVIIENLKTGPISEIYKVYLPPLPVTTTSAPSTTTSTLPPVIMLDMHLRAASIDPTGIVKVQWRPFTVQEKKFIDGVQVRYKKAGHENDEWRYSQILHRDTNFYILNKLEPGSTYVVDLIFTSIDAITANIISSKPLLVDLPTAPKDDFHFDFHIQPDDVTVEPSGGIVVQLRTVPQPISKYVNVAKIHYQNVQTTETFFNYANIDENDHQAAAPRLTIGNLLSNTRYKVWIELFLTNGQVITSNAIELITDVDKNFFKGKVGGLLTGATTSVHRMAESKYLVGVTIISVVMFLTGTVFLVTTCICLRRHSTAAITRVCISEAAYDNPTYKTFERSAPEKNGSAVTDTLTIKTAPSNGVHLTAK